MSMWTKHYTTKSECICERFRHEASRYPRDGYRAKDAADYTIPANTELKGEEWANMYGVYLRTKYNGRVMDINLNDLSISYQ